jgi:hypothetical protein
MSPIMSRDSFLCLAMRAWAVVWMLVFPLFHVHLEVHHHHGETGHIHDGTIHTVFSRDLNSEVDVHEEADGSTGTEPASLPFLGNATHPGDHPEFAFSCLNESRDRTPCKPLLTPVLFAESGHVLRPQSCGPLPENIPPAPFPRGLSREVPSRAPPSLFV